LKSREPVTTFYVSRALDWPSYLRRFFSWRAALGFKTLFGADDMKLLLDGALIELLERVRARA
jgi:hypothetical protein